MLKISNLQASVEGKTILRGVDLEIRPGEIHALMGPNGSGKSTLCYSVMGHPKYTVSDGEMTLDDNDLLALSTDKRARAGLFLGFQYPLEVPGMTFGNFLRQATNLRTESQMGPADYYKVARDLVEEMAMDRTFVGRGVNEGFSGGEKKRAEIVQMKALKPRFAFLDEIDSGLDIDALKLVARGISEARAETGIVLITHYQRLLHYVEADRVHVMMNGRIVHSGGMEVVAELEKKGYENFR